MTVPAIHFEAKNPVTIKGDYAAVGMGSEWMLVDTADLPQIAPYRWSVNRGNGGRPYAQAYAGGGRQASRFVKAHRIIMGAPEDKRVDHINGDTLDNRRANLRFVTHVENLINAPAFRHGKSGHRGVSWYPNYGMWRAYIHIQRKMRTLGYFRTIEEAIRARTEAEENLYPGINRRRT